VSEDKKFSLEGDRTCGECGDLIVVPTSDDDDLCVGCALTSDTNYKSVVRAMSASPGATAAASEERGPDV